MWVKVGGERVKRLKLLKPRDPHVAPVDRVPVCPRRSCVGERDYEESQGDFRKKGGHSGPRGVACTKGGVIHPLGIRIQRRTKPRKEIEVGLKNHCLDVWAILGLDSVHAVARDETRHEKNK